MANKFTDEQKRKAVADLQQLAKQTTAEKAVAKLAKDLGIGISTLWDWKRRAKEEEKSPRVSEKRERLQREGLGGTGAIVVGLGLQNMQMGSARICDALRSSKKPTYDEIRAFLREVRSSIDDMLKHLG